MSDADDHYYAILAGAHNAMEREKKTMHEVKCPHCGNTGKGKHIIYHVEMMPVYRRLEGVKMHEKNSGTPVYYLDYEDAYDAPEDAKDPMFHCGDCDNEWSVSRKSIRLDALSLEKTRFSDMKEEENGNLTSTT